MNPRSGAAASDTREGGNALAISSLFSNYKPALLRLPQDAELTKTELLTEAFRMASEGRIAMYYAPHNEWINRSAQVAIVGITPGWTQMKAAYESAVAGLAAGLPDEEICRRAKRTAGFAGPMRQHLTAMLDKLGLPERLGIRSSAELFREKALLLHTTSLLKYPVFVQERNYTGANPDMSASPLLWGQALAFLEELRELPDVLLIPLGRSVERVLCRMAEEGRIHEARILRGFPHPSGANGHRERQFAAQQDAMRAKLRAFYGR
ncbi:hypothetical protein P9847_15610 [Paenibacillus chibensis]|uniref:Uracil DNA glycosylase superfamily protein n=1 Tax=Paenibacillus chibensis TaxID=59846 RepID=A0ABU6PV17_9BACL|nr:hypothetical protein [Paenibacillus chibensis]